MLEVVGWCGIWLEVVGEAGSGRVVEARARGWSLELSPCYPGGPVDVWDPTGVRPFVKLWGLVAVRADIVVEPGCGGVVFSRV